MHAHVSLEKQKFGLIPIRRAYIDYAKFEELTQRGIIYVTKMKQNLTA